MPDTAEKSSARTPIRHAEEQFSGYCQRYSPQTAKLYATMIRELLDYTQALTIGELSDRDVQIFLNSKLPGRKNATINSYIGAIRSFCHWLSDSYDIPNPALKIHKLPVQDVEVRCLCRPEYDKILASLREDRERIQTTTADRNYHIIRFLANTGLRASEMIAVKGTDLQGTWLRVHGKGRKFRTIPLNKSALESLAYAIDFIKSRQTLFNLCYKSARIAGIAPFGPHALRHYFATELLAKGVPIHHVSRLLGHSSTQMTEKVYYHFRPEFLSGLTDCLQ